MLTALGFTSASLIRVNSTMLQQVRGRDSSPALMPLELAHPQSFKLAHPNICPIDELLEYVKGPTDP